MCEYCEIIPKLYYSVFSGQMEVDDGESQKILLDGWPQADLVIGADRDGKIYMEAVSNEYLEYMPWYPNFCPVCGRDLRDQNEKSEKT